MWRACNVESEMSQNTMPFDVTILQALMENEKREKVQRYRILNQYVRKGGIVFAGSSLMEQFPIYEFLLDDRLPYTIYNRGIGGTTIEELLRSMDACIYDLEPKAVFLNIGTNDLNDPACTIRKLEEQYEEVVKGILEHLPKARLFLLAYYPVNPEAADNPMVKEIFRSRTNEKIAEANSRIHALADRYELTFLDLNDAISDEQGNLRREYTVEGMHMYASGYRQIWVRLCPLLQELEAQTE